MAGWFWENPLSHYDDIISRGRACVRLIEAADVLLETKLDQYELMALKKSRGLVVRQLKELTGDTDPLITAQVMMASNKRLGTRQNLWLKRNYIWLGRAKRKRLYNGPYHGLL